MTEDVAVVTGALATYGFIEAHPEAAGVLGAIATGAAALTAALLKQGQ